ncbi:MAG TPA: DUF455 family protein [Candidatus Acidoferrales bacterium]|nr:DUF455 family protein [Candidatus Acidoferrales bacterium]
MELREFAEQILFGTTLAEKLASPQAITDERPGPALVTPVTPGRPANLAFKPHAAGKSDFPGAHRLENVFERGKLLHFFANHELLATELMALVLLKFPDAPAAFRKGVCQTLQDEQEHTRLYLERMQSCGLEFGDLPVSGYFWRCVSPMEHPIDYVAGLCLTFEQANLDFAGHYGRSFAKIGDADSAQLLDKIYRDEIGHVAYGLKWFRRWKNPAMSDWDAFCRTLKFPLSPQRAKGWALNLAGRRAAGLDPEFIAQLNVYSQSKGRTPSVFVFNAFTEGRLAEGKAFNPTKPQAQLARDLENLPQFLCRQDDIVLTSRKPSVEFLSRIKQAGFPLPEFVEGESCPTGTMSRGASETGAAALRRLAARKLGRLRPWAWGPDSFELLQPLFDSVTGEKRAGETRFNAGLAQLYAKSWSANFLRKIFLEKSAIDNPPRRSLGRPSETSWLCTENEIGVAVNSLAAALAAIAKIRARGHHRVVVKRSFGVAGSNALRLFEPEILKAQLRWLDHSFARNQELVVEPWLERIQDFSVQLEMTPQGLRRCGFTGLINDARGQFVANFAEAHHHTRAPAAVVSRFGQPADISTRLLEFHDEVFARLETDLRAVEFVGPLGIDALVYRDAAGNVRLKPIVEVNPRYTMGRVLLELMRQAGQNRVGVFRLVNAAQLRGQGFEDFSSYGRALDEKFPLRFEGEPVARIGEGALCLNDPATAESCLAVFQVGRRLAELLPA